MSTLIGSAPVKPVVAVASSSQRQGGPAIPVNVFTSLPAGRSQLGGKAQAVYFISASDLVQNGGQYRIVAQSNALPVVVVSAGVSNGPTGGAAIPVYDVTGLNWPPPGPNPNPPVSASMLTETGLTMLSEDGKTMVTE